MGSSKAMKSSYLCKPFQIEDPLPGENKDRLRILNHKVVEGGYLIPKFWVHLIPMAVFKKS
jgi:hypothetical protein